jgi:hypothetical protein
MFASLKCTATSATLAVLAWSPGALASNLATASYDTDSYLSFSTNNETSASTTIGRDIRPAYEFNFAAIEFDNADLNGLSTAGDKFLVIEVLDFVTSESTDGGRPTFSSSDTGNATIKVVGLGQSFDEYLAAASATEWYDTYLGDAAADATGSRTTLGKLYFDVTDVVNGWINDPTTNHGFGLVLTDGDDLIEIGATDDFFETGTYSPTLSSVPEPGSMAMLALGAVGLFRRRR